MRALLDVNVLLALLDASHLHHRLATDWLSSHLGSGWASCPVTQNGCVRIASQPSYRGQMPPGVIAERLGRATRDASHAFWPDAISLLDDRRIDWTRVLTSRQIADAYLLALAVQNRGRLVTFDRGIDVQAVAGAGRGNLTVLDGPSPPP